MDETLIAQGEDMSNLYLHYVLASRIYESAVLPKQKVYTMISRFLAAKKLGLMPYGFMNTRPSSYSLYRFVLCGALLCVKF